LQFVIPSVVSLNLCNTKLGQKGCLEQYGSGTALLNSAKELVASGFSSASRLRELAEAAGELTGTEVYQAIQEGDEAALALLAELGTNL
jgi:glucokinase